MARTAKKKIPVYNEGVLLSEDAEQFDFVGAGVTASEPTEDDIEVNVAGGGSPGTWTVAEVAGTINGSNVTFTLPSTPIAGSPFFLRIGRQPQEYTTDYTRVGDTITYVAAPDASLSGYPHIAEYYA